jgi:hypothetical protein
VAGGDDEPGVEGVLALTARLPLHGGADQAALEPDLVGNHSLEGRDVRRAASGEGVAIHVEPDGEAASGEGAGGG